MIEMESMTRELPVGKLVHNDQEYLIYKGINTIGRDENCTVALKSQTVTKLHAQIIVIKNEHYISDFHSTNKTKYGNKILIPMKCYKLHSKVSVIFGDIEMTYTILENANSRASKRQLVTHDGLTQVITNNDIERNPSQSLSCYSTETYDDAPTQVIKSNKLPVLDPNKKVTFNINKNDTFNIHDVSTQIYDESLPNTDYVTTPSTSCQKEESFVKKSFVKTLIGSILNEKDLETSNNLILVPETQAFTENTQGLMNNRCSTTNITVNDTCDIIEFSENTVSKQLRKEKESTNVEEIISDSDDSLEFNHHLSKFTPRLSSSVKEISNSSEIDIPIDMQLMAVNISAKNLNEKNSNSSKDNHTESLNNFKIIRNENENFTSNEQETFPEVDENFTVSLGDNVVNNVMESTVSQQSDTVDIDSEIITVKSRRKISIIKSSSESDLSNSSINQELEVETKNLEKSAINSLESNISFKENVHQTRNNLKSSVIHHQKSDSQGENFIEETDSCLSVNKMNAEVEKNDKTVELKNKQNLSEKISQNSFKNPENKFKTGQEDAINYIECNDNLNILTGTEIKSPKKTSNTLMKSLNDEIGSTENIYNIETQLIHDKNADNLQADEDTDMFDIPTQLIQEDLNTVINKHCDENVKSIDDTYDDVFNTATQLYEVTNLKGVKSELSTALCSQKYRKCVDQKKVNNHLKEKSSDLCSSSNQISSRHNDIENQKIDQTECISVDNNFEQKNSNLKSNRIEENKKQQMKIIKDSSCSGVDTDETKTKKVEVNGDNNNSDIFDLQTQVLILNTSKSDREKNENINDIIEETNISEESFSDEDFYSSNKNVLKTVNSESKKLNKEISDLTNKFLVANEEFALDLKSIQCNSEKSINHEENPVTSKQGSNSDKKQLNVCDGKDFLRFKKSKSDSLFRNNLKHKEDTTKNNDDIKHNEVDLKTSNEHGNKLDSKNQTKHINLECEENTKTLNIASSKPIRKKTVPKRFEFDRDILATVSNEKNSSSKKNSKQTPSINSLNDVNKNQVKRNSLRKTLGNCDSSEISKKRILHSLDNNDIKNQSKDISEKSIRKITNKKVSELKNKLVSNDSLLISESKNQFNPKSVEKTFINKDHTQNKAKEKSTSRSSSSLEIKDSSKISRGKKLKIETENINSLKKDNKGLNIVKETRKRTAVNEIKPDLPQKKVCEESSTCSPRRLQQRDKYNILFTKYQNDIQEAIAKKLGGKIVNSVEDGNILITEEIRRTPKLLSFVAQGKPIVSPGWLLACDAANKFLDPWDYLLHDKKAESNFDFKLKDSLIKASKGLLLSGWTILVTPAVMNADIKEMIENSGGKCLSRCPSNFPQNSFVISNENDSAKWPTILKKKIKPTIVSPEAIFSGLLRQKLELNRYSFS